MSRQTTLTYQNPRAAQRFWEKEQAPAAERNASVWEFMDKLPLTGRVALDMGCGFGRDVGEMRRRGAEAFGLDVSQGLLQRARDDYGPYFAEADFYNLKTLPFGLKAVDVFWSVAMFVHVAPTDVTKILQQWDGWLNVGGHMAIITKHGEGHATFTNLGEDLLRDMYYHQAEMLTQSLPQYRVVKHQTWQATAVHEEYMGLILEKPA